MIVGNQTFPWISADALAFRSRLITSSDPQCTASRSAVWPLYKVYKIMKLLTNQCIYIYIVYCDRIYNFQLF